VPIVGVGLAAAGIAALYANMSKSKQLVQDGIAPASRGPFTITDAYGEIGKTTPGDGLGIVATPNINKDVEGNKYLEMVSLLKTIANKDTNFSIGTQQLGTGMNMYTYNV